MEKIVTLPGDDIYFFQGNEARKTFFKSFYALDKANQKLIITDYYLQKVLEAISQKINGFSCYDSEEGSFFVNKKLEVKIEAAQLTTTKEFVQIDIPLYLDIPVLKIDSYRIVENKLYIDYSIPITGVEIGNKLVEWQQGRQIQVILLDSSNDMHHLEYWFYFFEKMDFEKVFNSFLINNDLDTIPPAKDFLSYLYSINLSSINPDYYEDLYCLNKSAEVHFPSYGSLSKEKRLELLYNAAYFCSSYCSRTNTSYNISILADFFFKFLIAANCINELCVKYEHGYSSYHKVTEKSNRSELIWAIYKKDAIPLRENSYFHVKDLVNILVDNN